MSAVRSTHAQNSRRRFIGSSRGWSARSNSPNGPTTAPCAIRLLSAFDKKNPRQNPNGNGRRAEMDAFLETQLKKGKKLAKALVEHLRLMGAAQCQIPVDDYLVIISVKIAGDEP